MDFSRREFLGVATAAVAAGATRTADAQSAGGADPCGCRNDFPVLQEWNYLNSPYIAPSPQTVVDAVTAFHQAKASDPISLGSMLEETTALRERFATLVNADTSEIGLLSTTSEGENIVTGSLDLRRGDNIVIDDLHYDTTVLLYDQLAASRGIEVRVVENSDGAADIDEFAAKVDTRTRIVSVSWVSHQNGYRHDLKALANLAHANGAYLYVDAIQGIGAVPLDVRDSNVDFFTAGGYKWLLAGFGVAPFFVRRELMDLVDADRVGWRQLESVSEAGERRFYSDARKFGYATPAFGAIYQMRAAVDYVLEVGVTNIAAHTLSLAAQLNEGLRELGFVVRTPIGNASPIVAFEHGADPAAAAARFDAARVKVSIREQGSQVRAGVALFNNDHDVDGLLEVARSLAG